MTLRLGCSSGLQCQLDFYSITPSTTNRLTNPEATAVADLNDDNLLDIVVISSTAKFVIVLLGFGNGTFRHAFNISTGEKDEYEAIMINDFNNDTHPDIIVLDRFSNQVGIFLGNGDGSFQTQLTMSTGPNSLPIDLAVGDVNNDGWLDVAVVNSASREIRVFLGYGNGSFQAQNPISTGFGVYPASLVMEDFNSDGRADIIVAEYANHLVRLYLGFANGTFRPEASTYYTLSPSRIRSADFNGDAAVDFAVMSYYHRDIGLFLNHGNGTFYPGPVLDVGDHGVHYSFEFADLDNDGNRDFITTKERTSDLLIFPGNGDGSFRAMKIFPLEADARPRWLSFGDFNNDSRLDLAVVKKGTSSVDILLNKC